MDEPTSGLDSMARRVFWKIIQELKQDKKTVIFTTQFLEEAEELADRLAIVSKGKLLAVGSVEFVKKKFGTEYTLVISNRKNPALLPIQAEQISKIISEVIPSAEIISDTTLNILKYTLSSFDQKKFSRVFRGLESIPDIQINLQRASLEEAFRSLERDVDVHSFRMNQLLKGKDENQIHNEFWTKKYKLSFKSQLKMIFLKRIYEAQDNKNQVATSLLLPILMLFSLKSLTPYTTNIKIVPFILQVLII